MFFVGCCGSDCLWLIDWVGGRVRDDFGGSLDSWLILWRVGDCIYG